MDHDDGDCRAVVTFLASSTVFFRQFSRAPDADECHRTACDWWIPFISSTINSSCRVEGVVSHAQQPPIIRECSLHTGRDTSPLAVHLGNDNVMRRLLRDGVGITDIQKTYLSLCYSARPSLRPNKDVAQGLGKGDLAWNLIGCEKAETMVVASLLMTTEAQRELRSVVISAAQADGSSVGRRGDLAKPTGKRGMAGLRGGTRELAMEKDPVGEVELYNALCKALPSLNALKTLELEGLRRAFEKSGAGAARLARGLKGNSKLKSITIRNVRLADARALGALTSALGALTSLVAISLVNCGLAGDSGGRVASSVIRAHAARREEMVWSAGLRRPSGVVGNTAAAAPSRISTAGCLSMDLSGNRLGDAGVRAVARGLQSDTWLVGLNLSRNEVTDRGAVMLSVCLQHNATLCALVLDGNPAIGPEAEERISVELETRSMMPEAILEEPEVILSLASWGFSAYANVDGNVPPFQGRMAGVSAASAGEIDSEISEISDDGFDGNPRASYDGGGGGRDRGAWSGFAHSGGAKPSSGPPKTLAERKEEMVYDFRRWAGYTPPAMQEGRFPTSITAERRGHYRRDDTPHDVNASGKASATSISRPRERSGFTAAAAAVMPAGDGMTARATIIDRAQTHDGENLASDSGRHRRATRARSLSSRSMTRVTGSDSGRVTKRSKSSGPPPGRISRARSRGCGSAATAARTERAPWGAGPRVRGARARAQAWARTHLRGVEGGERGPEGLDRARVEEGKDSHSLCACFASSRGTRRKTGGRVRGRMKSVRGRRRKKGVRRVRSAARSGGHGEGGEHHRDREDDGDHESALHDATTMRDTRQRAGARRVSHDRIGHGFEVNGVNGASMAEGWQERQPWRREASSALDVTRVVLDQNNHRDFPDLTPRRRGHYAWGATADPREPTARAEAVDAHGSNNALQVERTDRVVNMLVSLEKTVMEVCKEMWRLEDKVESSSEPLATHASEQKDPPRAVRRAQRSAREGSRAGDVAVDEVDAGVRREVAAQVEACLREMWRTTHLDRIPDEARTVPSEEATNPTGSPSRLPNSAAMGDEEEEGGTEGFHTHKALQALDGSVDDDDDADYDDEIDDDNDGARARELRNGADAFPSGLSLDWGRRDNEGMGVAQADDEDGMGERGAVTNDGVDEREDAETLVTAASRRGEDEVSPVGIEEAAWLEDPGVFVEDIDEEEEQDDEEAYMEEADEEDDPGADDGVEERRSSLQIVVSPP